MIGAVRVAVQKDAASLHRTAADHLVHKGPGKQGRLIGIGTGSSHSLKLVLGIVLVRSEQVIAVPADDHLSLPAFPFIGNTQGLQHGQHRAEHIPCQGSGSDTGHDEIPSLEAGQAPEQEGQDHRHRLSAPDRPVRQHNAPVFISGPRHPPVKQLPLFAGKGLKLETQDSSPPSSGSANSSCISSRCGAAAVVRARIAASAFFCGSIPALGRKRLYCWEIRVALFFS